MYIPVNNERWIKKHLIYKTNIKTHTIGDVFDSREYFFLSIMTIGYIAAFVRKFIAELHEVIIIFENLISKRVTFVNHETERHKLEIATRFHFAKKTFKFFKNKVITVIRLMLPLKSQLWTWHKWFQSNLQIKVNLITKKKEARNHMKLFPYPNKINEKK